MLTPPPPIPWTTRPAINMFPDVAQPHMALPTIIMTTLRIMSHRLPQMFAICPHRGWTIMLHTAGQQLPLRGRSWLAMWGNMHLQSKHNCFRHSTYAQWWVKRLRWLLLRWRREWMWRWAQRRASKIWSCAGISILFAEKRRIKEFLGVVEQVHGEEEMTRVWGWGVNAEVT